MIFASQIRPMMKFCEDLNSRIKDLRTVLIMKRDAVDKLCVSVPLW